MALQLPPGIGLPDVILATGALGTAAYGLVDVSKAGWGGISNAGFGHVQRALRPYAAALNVATDGQWLGMLRAHWLNGRTKEEQKAIVRALVRLGITPETAPALAKATRVDPERLKEIAAQFMDGKPLDDADLNVLGRFDAVLESELDAAFERADQQYRSAARSAAAVVSVGLALIAAYYMLGMRGEELLFAALIGVFAVPLSPVAKDLASALNAAVNAVRARVN